MHINIARNEKTGTNYVAEIHYVNGSTLKFAFGNRKILAIKWVRELTRWGLADAKSFVDNADCYAATITNAENNLLGSLGVLRVELMTSTQDLNTFEYIINA